MRRAVTHLKKSDPVLASIIERVGPLRLSYRDPSFENMARSIVYQQLHGKAAATIFGRLVEAAGGVLTPDAVLALTDDQMRKAGLSKQKLSYIRDLAARTASGEIAFDKLADLSDEEVIEHLTRVKGIGRWSAQMFLIFALRRPNIMPTVDLGINVAIQRAYRKRKLPKPAHILKLAERWHPYCSAACWYLWRFSEIKDPAAKPKKRVKKSVGPKSR